MFLDLLCLVALGVCRITFTCCPGFDITCFVELTDIFLESGVLLLSTCFVCFGTGFGTGFFMGDLHLLIPFSESDRDSLVILI